MQMVQEFNLNHWISGYETAWYDAIYKTSENPIEHRGETYSTDEVFFPITLTYLSVYPFPPYYVLHFILHVYITFL